MIQEAPRDQAESSFTRIIREFLEKDPRYLGCIFVDREGECVDYCSLIDAYELKVIGAQLQVVLANLRPHLTKLVIGELESFYVGASKGDLLLRRVDEEYSLALLTTTGGVDEHTLEEASQLAQRLREEAGLETPYFDSIDGPLDVALRESIGYGYAPIAIRRGDSVTVVADVLGYFEEHGGIAGGPLDCFHVRLEDGVEFLLVRDAENDRWYRFPLGF